MFGKMDHVSIEVADMDKALAFYQGTAGMKIAWDRVLPTGVRLVMLAGAGETRLELSVGSAGIAPGHIKHVAYKADDLTAAIGSLEAAGFTFHRKPQKPGDTKVAFLRDPDGSDIELVDAKAGL